MSHSYTFGIKTAISIPDKVFAEAERLSRRLKKSRSQVYTEAVTEYIARHDPEAVTEAMNRVCEAVDTYPDPAIAAAARRTLEDVRMVVAQGQVYWANLPDPTGSGPGFRRPVLVVQGDALNRSRIRSVVCVPLTSNLRWAEAPGNVLLPARATGLPKDSVANVSQIITLDRELLTEEVGKLSKRQLELILTGIDIVLGR